MKKIYSEISVEVLLQKEMDVITTSGVLSGTGDDYVSDPWTNGEPVWGGGEN